MANGSNPAIQDVIVSPTSMVEEIVKECLNKKLLVFVTGSRGKDIGTASDLSTKIGRAGGRRYSPYTGKLFETNCQKAKIAGVGANIHPGTVYDFQISLP